VPILQLALSSKKLPQMQLFDLGSEFHPAAARDGRRRGRALAVRRQDPQVQVDLDQHAMQAHNVSADDVVNAISVQNLILPAGDEKIGKFDWNVALNASPRAARSDQRSAGEEGQRHDHLHARRRLCARGSPPQTNLVRVNGARAVLMTILKAGAASTLGHRGIKALLPRVEESLPARLELHAVGDQSVFVKAAVFGVIREAVLAAALVGVMILMFLGSWRSTVIILVEIPLAILCSPDASPGWARHQRHDARRARACGRHSGRRRYRDHREHQLPSGAG
jgi:multidrug efflux pump subunit AcrB